MQPKILLIYPPNQLMDIETPRPDGSLGPLYLAGALEAAGYETDILDASIGTLSDSLKDTFFKPVKQANGLIRIGMTTARIQEEIAKGGYTVVGIASNFTPQMRMALEVAQAAKQVSRDIYVVTGGVNARNLAERFLKSGVVDAVCLSEGERIIVNLVRALGKGEKFDEITGLATMRDGKVVRREVSQDDICVNLDDLPFPAWEKLAFAHYDHVTAPHAVLPFGDDRYMPIMFSRGCPFRCEYCHISVEKADTKRSGGIGALRLKSIERVLQEVGRVQALGAKKLYIEDDSLLAKKERVCVIFNAIRGRGLQIADVNGVNLVHFQKNEGGRLVIDRDYLLLLKEAGFDQIVFPVESASQRILDRYATAKLNHETLNVHELVRIAVKVGIACPINMMIGFPDETEDEMRKSIELGKQLVEAGAPYCTFFIPIPFPGSGLYELALSKGHLNRDFDTDIFNWKNAVMRNTVVPPERILELRDEGWRYANTDSHVRARLEASIGTRWQSGRPA